MDASACLNNDKVKNRIVYLLAKIDQLINKQLSAVLNCQCLKQLEATWRGVAYLVNHLPKKRAVKIRVLSVTRKELLEDLNYAFEFDQSALFQKIYSAEFGMPGGEPFSVLLGDYEFSHHLQDINLLKGLAQIAAAAFAPFIAAAAPALFGVNSFSELGHQPNLANLFKQQDYHHWQQLRAAEDSRFLGLVLPRQLLRLPYKLITDKKLSFTYKEPEPHKAYLWGNACYGFAVTLMRAFTEYGWLAAIHGVSTDIQTGGCVPPAAKACFATEQAGFAPQGNAEIWITDTQEKIFSDLGFIPLCERYNSDTALFYSSASIQKAKIYSQEIANQNAQAATILQYIFCASRFAHYIKIIVRDKLGSFNSAQVCEKYLNDWLLDYTAGNVDLPFAKRAKYPLQAAKVQVRANPAKLGSYLCKMYLKPYFQLENVAAHFVVLTELTSAM